MREAEDRISVTGADVTAKKNTLDSAQAELSEKQKAAEELRLHSIS